jgi:hypothetical protein
VASILPSVDPSVLPSVDPSILPIDWPIDSSHRYVSRFLCSFIFLRFQMVKYMFVCFEYCCEYCCEMWIFRSLIFVAVNILQVAVNIVVNFWLFLFVYFCLSWYWLSLFVCFCFCFFDVISILWMSLFASASASVCWPFQFSVMFSEVRRRPNFFFGLTRVKPGQPIWPVTRSLDRVDDRVGF